MAGRGFQVSCIDIGDIDVFYDLKHPRHIYIMGLLRMVHFRPFLRSNHPFIHSGVQ